MKVKQIMPDYWVSPQLSVDDVAIARAQGFRSIVVNRPDAEEPGQPSIAAMRKAADEAGLGFAAVPVRPGHVTDQDVAQFATAIARLDGPVLAYCRTGSRAATLWALSAADSLGPDTVLNAVAATGHDITPLRSRLVERHGLRGQTSSGNEGERGSNAAASERSR